MKRKPRNALVSNGNESIDLGILDMTPVQRKINLLQAEEDFAIEWEERNKIILRSSQTLQ